MLSTNSRLRSINIQLWLGLLIQNNFSYPHSVEDVKREIEKVKRLIEEENLDIEVFPGQEVYYTDNILENYNNNLPKLAIKMSRNQGNFQEKVEI